MKFGIVGLGRMGLSLRVLAVERGHDEHLRPGHGRGEVGREMVIDQDIPVPVTGMSQQMLMAYRDLDWPAAKSVALLRNQYGGHRIHRADEDEELPAALGGMSAFDDSVVPWVTFTDPEVGRVGTTEQQVYDAYGERARVVVVRLNEMAAARLFGEFAGASWRPARPDS